MDCTCSYGAYQQMVKGLGFSRIWYSLVNGKVAKIQFNGVWTCTIDNGGPTEAAFLNQYPNAVKMTDIF